MSQLSKISENLTADEFLYSVNVLSNTVAEYLQLFQAAIYQGHFGQDITPYKWLVYSPDMARYMQEPYITEDHGCLINLEDLEINVQDLFASEKEEVSIPPLGPLKINHLSVSLSNACFIVVNDNENRAFQIERTYTECFPKELNHGKRLLPYILIPNVWSVMRDWLRVFWQISDYRLIPFQSLFTPHIYLPQVTDDGFNIPNIINYNLRTHRRDGKTREQLPTTNELIGHFQTFKVDFSNKMRILMHEGQLRDVKKVINKLETHQDVMTVSECIDYVQKHLKGIKSHGPSDQTIRNLLSNVTVLPGFRGRNEYLEAEAKPVLNGYIDQIRGKKSGQN